MLLAAIAWHLARKWRVILLLTAGLVAVAFGRTYGSARKNVEGRFDCLYRGPTQYAPHNDPANLNSDPSARAGCAEP